MPPILDERKADANVITSLLNEIRRLQPMGKLMKDETGKLYQVDAYAEVTEDELRQEIVKQTEAIVAAQNNIEMIKTFLSDYNKETTTANDTQVFDVTPEAPTQIHVSEAPTEPTPPEPVAPVAEAPQAPVLQ